MYDNENIFAKILRKEIPSKLIYEDDYVISLFDINPKAATHALIITKNAYEDFNDFISKATKEEVKAVMDDVHKVAEQLNLIEAGYRIVINVGKGAGQEVPHLHIHILSNKSQN